MLPLITAKMKDDTLQWLCANVRPGQMLPFDFQALLEAVGTDADTANAILGDFKDTGLISDLNPMRQGTFLQLHVKAHAFLQRGGFAVEDALNEANIQKILYDLENLKKQINGKPDQLEIFNKISAIASALTTVYAAFHGSK